MVRLSQMQSPVTNFDALKTKKPGIPRLASQRLKPIEEIMILPVKTMQNRQGYSPMMITSNVDADSSSEL